MILHSLMSAISLTYCTITSAKQKSIATKTPYTATWNSISTYCWHSFTFHITAEDIEYESPDFRWDGIFDFDTYTNHIKKLNRQQ